MLNRVFFGWSVWHNGARKLNQFNRVALLETLPKTALQSLFTSAIQEHAGGTRYFSPSRRSAGIW